ncbi:MAG TPA: BrnT family toxin [Thermomicrobiales bacterium]|nr:BrnT family toxin [Thermomicrobiales bacterium]
MEFEWDETKRLGNIQKHGFDFASVREMFDGRPLIHMERVYQDERRYASTGWLEDVYCTVIWTRRGEAIRLISARRARDNERRAHRALYG